MVWGYPHESTSTTTCIYCGDDMWDDEYYELDGRPVCDDCVRQLAKDRIDEFLEKAAELIGAERVTR